MSNGKKSKMSFHPLSFIFIISRTNLGGWHKVLIQLLTLAESSVDVNFPSCDQIFRLKAVALPYKKFPNR